MYASLSMETQVFGWGYPPGGGHGENEGGPLEARGIQNFEAL